MNSIIEIKNVSFKYKGSNESLLDNVSLSVNQGETLLLCGPSGSGKTTIIRLINGLIPHYYQGEISGEVEVLGRNIKETELYDLAGIVGTVFQNPRSQFFSVDTDGEIVFGPENIGLDPKVIIERSNHVVSEMKLEKLLGRSLFELSGGEKQKIACASVAALLPDIILLDEPSSNLDWGAIADLKECIERWKSQGKTIVISEHRLWYLAGLIDRVIYMDEGAIKSEWSGTEFESFDESAIKELKLRPTVLEERLIRNFSEANHSRFEGDSLGGYKLKDFYFAYKKKPYVFRKKSFSKADDDLLDLNIPELVLPSQSIIGIIGENGAGKSTFLRCLCGLENDCTGVVIKEGKEYAGKKRLSLSYMVMQDVNHQLFTDSVKAEVLLSMKEEDEERCYKILDSLGILELKDKHPMALSGGQKQRVAIASALAAEADLILLDEPTSGLDYSHMVKVAKLLQKLAADGKTVLVSTHDPELIEICCTHVLRLEKGKGEIFEIQKC